MESNRLLESQLRIELLQVLQDHEAFWAQRSRIQWVREGGKNTKFFHRVASIRRLNNFIKGIQAPNGEWISDSYITKNILVSRYKQLFARDINRAPNWDLEPTKILSLTKKMKLDKSISSSEIDLAIQNMAPLKL